MTFVLSLLSQMEKMVKVMLIFVNPDFINKYHFNTASNKMGKLFLNAESKHVCKLQSGMFAVVSKASIKDVRLVFFLYLSASVKLIFKCICCIKKSFLVSLKPTHSIKICFTVTTKK